MTAGAPLSAMVLAGGRARRMGGVAKPLLEVGGRTLLDAALDAAWDAGAGETGVVGPGGAAPGGGGGAGAGAGAGSGAGAGRRPGAAAGRAESGRQVASAAAADHAIPIDGGQRSGERDRRTIVVRENPPFAGPAAAIGAALPHVTGRRVLVLAADLPRAGEAVATLLASTSPEDLAEDGIVLRDTSGRSQWLTAIYDTEALREAFRRLPDAGRDAPLTRLVEGLHLRILDAPEGLTDDVDTWEDLRKARAMLARGDATDDARDDPRAPADEEERRMTDTNPRTLPPEALEEWADALRQRFDLAEEDLPISLILDLARDVANSVARPAAPFSAYAAGLVAGRAGGNPAAVREAVAAVTALAADWESRPEDSR